MRRDGPAAPGDMSRRSMVVVVARSTGGVPLGPSRRRFLQGLGASGAAVVGAQLLAACGTAPAKPISSSQVTDTSDTDKKLNFTNWPLYIDVDEDDPNKRPTLEAFEKETGISVTYNESINDNDEFYAKISPQLSTGQAIGSDIVVLTDWLASRLKNDGYLQQLDHANLSTAMANMNPALAHPGFDPNRDFTIPWQSGLTGLAYNPKAMPFTPTSYNDLWDPRIKGRVTLFSGLRESLPMLLLANGAALATFTESDFDNALALLEQQVDSGQVRRLTGNDYTADLVSGDVAACLAYSGDIFQLKFDNPEIEFLLPQEGGEIWSDTMMVPAGSPHKKNAERLMDFYYRPEIAAQLAAWVNYVCPVPAAQDELAKIDEDLASSPLIFPTDNDLANVQISRDITPEEEARWTDAWTKAIG
jgi:spermidine/putrescine transport system substrate-binding protein